MKTNLIQFTKLFALSTALLFFAAGERVYGQGCGGYLLDTEYSNHVVLRYDATTGAFIDEFVSRQSGGLNQPYSIVVGPHDRNLYVSAGHFRGPGRIKAPALRRCDRRVHR